MKYNIKKRFRDWVAKLTTKNCKIYYPRDSNYLNNVFYADENYNEDNYTIRGVYSIDNQNRIKMLEEMFNIQEIMNNRIDEKWRSRNNDYGIAAILESAELIDHLDWKWWKSGKNDIKQAYIESIDIHHFLMSIIVDPNKNNLFAEYLLSSTYDEHTYNFDIKSIENTTLEMIEYILSYNKTCDEDDILNAIACNIRISFMLCGDFEKFYKTYIGKNALNMFRQDNGYNDGTYIKIWNGEEDNVYLEKIMQTNNVFSDIYNGLELAYKEIIIN